jgi:hypothetical protein
MAGGITDVEAITDAKTLVTYLRTRPVSEVQVFILRSAIRAMPSLSDAFMFDVDLRKKLIVGAFRNVMLSWALQRFLNHRHAFFIANKLSVNSALKSDISALTEGALSSNPKSVSSWMISMFAAAAAASARPSGAVENARDAIKYQDEGPKFWAFVRTELRCFLHDPVGELLALPLWPKEYDWKYELEIGKPFPKLLASFGPQWYLPFSFYKALLIGVPPFASLGSKVGDSMLEIAVKGADFWNQDPDSVMRELTERLGDVQDGGSVGGGSDVDWIQERLDQVPADFSFRESDTGAIDAMPFSALASDSSFAGTTLTEAREKAQELALRLTCTNAPGRVARSVERLRAVLPERLADLNPALLRSRSRSLEADSVAYGAAGAEAELFPDAVSEMFDLVGTLKDLQGCFPSIADVERNTMAIEFSGREDAVERDLSVISASARELSSQHPSMITEEAADAVAALDADVADAVNPKVKRDLLARSALIKQNFLSAVYRKVLSPAGREAMRVAKLHYDGTVSGSVKGISKVAEVAPLALLVYYLAGPVAAVVVSVGAQFKSLKEAKEITDQLTGGGRKPEE